MARLAPKNPVNLETASLLRMDREQRRLIVREIIAGLAATRPPRRSH